MVLYAVYLLELRQLAFSYPRATDSAAVDVRSISRRLVVLTKWIAGGYKKDDGSIVSLFTPEDEQVFIAHDLSKLRVAAAKRLGIASPADVIPGVPILRMFQRLLKHVRPWLKTVVLNDRLRHLSQVVDQLEVSISLWKEFVAHGTGLELAVAARTKYLRDLSTWLRAPN